MQGHSELFLKTANIAIFIFKTKNKMIIKSDELHQNQNTDEFNIQLSVEARCPIAHDLQRSSGVPIG